MCDLDLLKKSISEDAKVALMNNLGSQNFERPKPNQPLVYIGDNASVASIANNTVSSWASKRFGPKFSANWVQTQRDNNRTLIDVRIPEILDLALNVKYGGTSLQTANNILKGLDEDDSEISLSGYGKPSVESKNLDKRFNSTLQNRLIEFIEGLNIEVAIDPEVLKTFTVKGQNPRTAFDLLQKYLALPSDVTDKEVSLQTANIIYQFLGKKSILQTNLRASIENWSKYDEVYKKYKTKGVSHSFAKKQATLQFLAEIIELGATQNFNVESIENIDVDKNYFSRLGYKNPYEINAFKRLLNIVWNWINEHILRNKVNFILKEQELKNLAMDIVNDVYQKDYKKFIRKYADVDGKIIDLNTGEELEQKYYEETLNKDPFAKSIILSFFNNPFMDYKLSGSQVVRKYGKLLRALSEDLHDIDGIITLEQMRKEGNYLEMINWIDQRGLKLSNSNRTKTFKRELTKFLEEQSWYKNLKSLYPEWELKEAFIGRDHKDGESITITGIIPHPTEIDPETGKKKEYIIDFFVRTKEGSYPEIFDNYWKDWKQIFEAKVNMGRAKDINDLIYFEPFKKDKYKFTNRGFRYFTMESEQRKDSNLIEEEVSELFDSNPELANSVYRALGFTANISLESNLKNTGKTEQDLIEYLKNKYPEIKLNITNNPVWEQGDNIFNQEEYNNQVNYRLKLVSTLINLSTPKVDKRTRKYGEVNQPERLTFRLNSKERPYLETNIRKQLRRNGVKDNQIDFIFDYMKSNNIQEISTEELITRMLADYSYTVEINTATISETDELANMGISEKGERPFTPQQVPTQYYSDLTVPGGTNYTENEISTPLITPSIKGHAQFATDQGIGWFRSDEQIGKKEEIWEDIDDWAGKRRDFKELKLYGSKTRRILELQSDLFQKGRDKDDLIQKDDYNTTQGSSQGYGLFSLRNINYAKTRNGFFKNGIKISEEEYNKALEEHNSPSTYGEKHVKENKFLQLLNKNNNWVRFFIQSIIQDSAKKGYEKVLFPLGDTAAKIEGHQTLEEFKKQKEDRIITIGNNLIKKYLIDNNLKEDLSTKITYKGKTGRIFNLKKEFPELTNAIYSLENNEFKLITNREQLREELTKNNDEINQLKQELADVESGQTQLSSIANFYETTLTNILKKNGFNPVETTDEYGNKWNEISITPKVLSDILLQRNEANQIIGQANIKAGTVLIDAINQKQDTLPHEYAHHYIAWFRDTPIVQEGIKKWGSEEALVQSIGEQVVKQKGEAYNWWNKFVKWIMNQFNSLSELQKEELTQILTDAFLTRQDLGSKQDIEGFKEFVDEQQKSTIDIPKAQLTYQQAQQLDRVQYLDELVEKQLAEGTKALVEMGAATTKGNDTARATEGLSKLVDQINNFAQRTGVEYEILSTVEEAANVIGNANTIGGLSANSIIASGAPAFFYNGKVYFIAPRLSMSAVFHEFSHPIIKALSNVEGKKLFNSLYEQAIGTSEGQQIQNQMLSEFPEGSQETDDFKEELIIRALDKIYSANKYKNPVSKDFNSFTNKLFFAIKQFLRKVFGIKIKVEKLSHSTTLEELAAMITGDKFSIDIPKITREDFVAFNMAQQNQISEINKINDQDLFDLINDYQSTLSRIRSDINTKNLTELKKLLIGKEDNKMILSEILSDLYSAKKNSEEFIRSTTTTVLAETQKTLASNTLSRNLESISNIADILQKSIENINSNNLSVEDQKAFAGKIQYASEIVDYIEQLFQNTQLAMKEAGVKSDTPEWQTITLFFGKLPALKNVINEKMISILSEVTSSLVTDMRESVIRQAISDLKKAINNNPTIQQKIENGFEDLTDADLSNIDSKVQATILRSYKNFKSDYEAISKEALNDILSGNYKDNSKLNTLLESYTNNQNPVIGSFAAFYKQQRASAEALTVRETANFMEGLRRLIEGYSQDEVANFADSLTFKDTTFTINKDGDVEEKIVLTYLNRFKNYRFELKKREVAFEKANRDGTYAEKSAAYQELQDFKRKYFWQEYSQDYYNLDKIYQEIDAEDLDALYEEDKDLYEIRPDGVYFEGKALENPNSLNNVALIKEHIANTIGSTAFLDKQVILDNLNATQRSARTETELFEKNNEIEALQRTYRQLFSLTYEDGVTLKTGKDLIKTKLHIKYREKSNSFVEYKLIEGAFERSLRNFLDELALRETPGTDEYYKQRDEWIRQNSQIEFTNDYYEERRKAIEKLKAFTESKLPDSPEAKLIAENYKIIYSILSIFKDTDNAPDALDMGPKRIANIKRLMEEIQEARSNMAIKSGLTKKEDIELQSLWEQIKSGNPLNGLQQRRFDKLSKKKVTGGLSKTDKNTYNKLIAEVAGFTEKVPTQQYLDSLNYWLNTRLSLGLSEVTEENANMYLSYDKIAPYLRMDSEFKDWFEANHILTEYYDYDLEDTVYVYKRVSAWEMSRPADEDYLKQTELNIIDEKTGKPMVLKRVPKSRFKKRVVKDEFRLVKENEDWTMYIGKYFDNRGRYLPRDYVPGDPNSAEDDFLINEKYDELRVNDPKKFAILEYMKQQQLKEESKLEQNYAKLYLDLPRYYLKTGIERRKDIRQDVKRKVETVKRAFSNAKVNDDVAAELLVDETLNLSEDLAFVETDILGNRREVIPIGGMTALETNQVSKDVVRGHLKRMIDIAKFNVLQDTAPVAKAFVSTLNENKPKDMNSIDRKLYQNRGKLAFTKSKSKSNVAGEAMAYFYEREYLGKKNAEEVNPYVDQLFKGLMKQVSFGYFALDLASAAKNYFSQLIQNGIETAGGEYIDVQSLAIGKAMAYAHTSKNLFQRLDRGSKDLSTQMILAFDPIQDRYQDDFADSYTNSIWNELASLKFFMAPRRFLERESVLELFFAMMSKKLIDQKLSDGKVIKIRYSEAFETDSEGNMVLKKGVDERYAVGGSEFAKFRIIVQEKSNLLYGTYAKMDQPMAQKYFAFRLMSWLRRYFTSMFINRWGFKLKPGGKIYKASSYQYRYNWALNEMTRGYYIESMIALTKTLRTVGAYAPYMSKREAIAIRKTLYDALAAILLAISAKLLFGYDGDDKERFEKLRKLSGPLGSDNFKLDGWLTQHAIYQMKAVFAETTTFIPLPGLGEQEILDVGTVSNVLLGRGVGNYTNLLMDLFYISTGNERASYKRDMGPFPWQDKGDYKIYNHIGKMFGVKGKFWDPVLAIKAQETIEAMGQAR